MTFKGSSKLIGPAGSDTLDNGQDFGGLRLLAVNGPLRESGPFSSIHVILPGQHYVRQFQPDHEGAKCQLRGIGIIPMTFRRNRRPQTTVDGEHEGGHHVHCSQAFLLPPVT